MNDLAKTILESNGQHFWCRFEKKDGTIRDLYGCLRPKEDSKGLKYVPKDYGLICVYDLDAEGYRMVNAETLQKVALIDEDFDAIEDEVIYSDGIFFDISIGDRR